MTAECWKRQPDAPLLRADCGSGFDFLEISADGHFVVFESDLTDLVADDDINGQHDAFIRAVPYECGGTV